MAFFDLGAMQQFVEFQGIMASYFDLNRSTLWKTRAWFQRQLATPDIGIIVQSSVLIRDKRLGSFVQSVTSWHSLQFRPSVSDPPAAYNQ